GAMTDVSGVGALRTWEYAFLIPEAGMDGGWTATVTALEGTEGEVSHVGNGGFLVGGRVSLTKIWGAEAVAGHQVNLAIAGGSDATPGSSTAPATTTAATALANAGETIFVSETFEVGAAGNYTATLACRKVSDGTTVATSGSGLSRSFIMPSGS